MRREYSSREAEPFHAAGDGEEAAPACEDASRERHYSILEVAALWGLSEKTIRKLFQNEPGVVEIGSRESRFRRAYVTRRIPESVLQRVHRRLRKTA